MGPALITYGRHRRYARWVIAIAGFRRISKRVWGSNFDLRSRRQSVVQFLGRNAASRLHT